MKNIFFLLLLVGISTRLYSQKLEPSETHALLTVSVINEKEKPQVGEQVLLESVTNKKVYSGITKEGGKFDILVPKGDKYNIKYKTISSDKNYNVLDVPNKKGELLSFEVTIQFELPKVYTLDNVYFETGKADIKTSSFKYIDEMVEYMKLKKTMEIEIAGHTDNVGTPESNLKLSLGRANSVRSYLLKKGIAEERVSAKGYGDTQPVASNDSESGKQKNRRTEVRVIKE